MDSKGVNMLRIVLFSILVSSPAWARPTTFQPLPPKPTALDDKIYSTLIGGDEARAEDFPATVYSTDGSGRCTATLIGPQVLITAAHCVDNGGQVFFTLLTGQQHRGVCQHHPDYDNNKTADWALCRLEEEADVEFETLSMDRTIPARGDRILLTGYGCTAQGGGGGNDGTLRYGFAEVIQTPRSGNWDIITRGSVALCFGDSGGPAFHTYGSEDPTGRRVMISVNSRGNIKDTSYLSKTLQNSVFSGWLKAWAADQLVTVCGVSRTEGCRSAGAPPPPDPGEPDTPPDPDGDTPPAPDPGKSAPWWIWILILGGGGLGAWLVSWIKKRFA
jgi:hypothetical protein